MAESAPRRVTLTFDNGPSPEATPAVLDVLATRGIRAWFCVVGRRVAADGGAELVGRALADGHRVVNHSMNHLTPLGEDPTSSYAEAEIVGAARLLDELAPMWTAHGRWFRPFGRGGRLGPHVLSSAALALFEAHRYSVLLWNSVPRDWIDVDTWPSVARSHVAAQPHTVLVLHDLPTGAMAHLPAFLDDLQSEGIDITLDPPDSCVIVSDGVPTRDLAPLTTESD